MTRPETYRALRRAGGVSAMDALAACYGPRPLTDRRRVVDEWRRARAAWTAWSDAAKAAWTEAAVSLTKLYASVCECEHPPHS